MTPREPRPPKPMPFFEFLGRVVTWMAALICLGASVMILVYVFSSEVTRPGAVRALAAVGLAALGVLGLVGASSGVEK